MQNISRKPEIIFIHSSTSKTSWLELTLLSSYCHLFVCDANKVASLRGFIKQASIWSWMRSVEGIAPWRNISNLVDSLASICCPNNRSCPVSQCCSLKMTRTCWLRIRIGGETRQRSHWLASLKFSRRSGKRGKRKMMADQVGREKRIRCFQPFSDSDDFQMHPRQSYWHKWWVVDRQVSVVVQTTKLYCHHRHRR